MQRPPRPPERGVIDRRVIAYVVGIGVALTVTGLPVFFYALRASGELPRAQTLLFTLLVLGELAVVQVIRVGHGQSLLCNPWLNGAIIISLGLQALVLYTPLATALGVTEPTSGWPWLALALVGFIALTSAMAAVIERLLPMREMNARRPHKREKPRSSR